MKTINASEVWQHGSLLPTDRRSDTAGAMPQPPGGSWRWQVVGIVSALLCMGPGRATLAQPALERLERQVRDGLSRKASEDQREVTPPSEDDRIGYLGVIADDSDVSGLGVRIVNVVGGTPAAKAGLKVGDLVTKIGDRLVRDLDDFAAALHNMPVGRKLRFTIERDFEPRRVEVTLGKRPPKDQRPVPEFGRVGEAAAPPPPRMSLLGVRVETVDAEAQAVAGLPNAEGALVSEVTEGSPAEMAGVPERAVIVAVDGKQVASPADLKRLIAAAGPGKEIRLDYYDRGKLIERRMRLAELVGPGGDTADDAEAPPVAADEARDNIEAFTPQQRIERLEDRIQKLEARLIELEQLLAKPRGE